MMTGFGRILAGLVAAGAIAVPAAAQYYPPQQPYPQQYPQPYPPGYYPQQQYGNQSTMGQIIDRLLGNRYNVTDRNAVSRCAGAAVQQAQARYTPYGGGYNQGYNQGYPPGYGNQGYQGQGYAYGQGYNQMRVTAITSVERRSNGLRVRGLLDSGRYGNQGYPYQGQGYGNQGYGNQGYGDLTFRCNVDYRGYVSNVRIERNTGYRRY